MPSLLTPVTPSIRLFRDAVNVYVLRWEDGSVGLFDLGSGAVLDVLQAEGYAEPELVIQTDFRRDRTSGHSDHPGLPVAIGAEDVPHMSLASRVWSSLAVEHGYAEYESFLAPRQSIKVSHSLRDGELVNWQKPYVYAQHIGAHTPGGMGYLVIEDGKRYLISGDILQADGTLHSVYELQRNYNFMEGLQAARRAVGWLASGDIDGVLPSHGEPILGVENVVAAATTLLARIDEFWERWRLIWPDQPPGHVSNFDPITPHLRGATNLIQYALVDDDGNAALFDTGSGYSEGFHKTLAKKGIRNVDIAFITHPHDDHVMGFEWLKKRYGTRLAAHECMVDVLKNPRAYALNCLHDRPLEVDVVLRDGEPYLWRNQYRIYPHFFPSQTQYHAVYFCEVDGQMVLLSGDALYWEPGAERLRPTNPDWRNRFDVDRGYLVGAGLLPRYQPRLLAAAHVHPWPISEEACNEFPAHAQAFHDSLRALVGRQHPTLGIDPMFVSIYPYHRVFADRMPVEVRIDNPLNAAARFEITPCLPAGVGASLASLEVEMGPKEHARVPLTLTAGSGLNRWQQTVWALRVVVNGEDLGEFCEGLLVPE